MKKLLLLIVLSCNVAMAQTKGNFRFDTISYRLFLIKCDTIFVGIDTSHIKLGFEGYNGGITGSDSF